MDRRTLQILRELLGYLLYGGQYPTLKVFQLFVALPYRGMSIAQKLITELVEFGERNNYLTISARVAADLAANRFWNRAGFSITRQVPGGEKSQRTINVQVRMLDTPSLLKMMAREASAPGRDLQSLKIGAQPLISSQIYVLDLNVFFDMVKRRSLPGRGEQINRLRSEPRNSNICDTGIHYRIGQTQQGGSPRSDSLSFLSAPTHFAQGGGGCAGKIDHQSEIRHISGAR